MGVSKSVFIHDSILHVPSNEWRVLVVVRIPRMATENHFTIQEELEDADFYPLGNGESVDNAVGSSLYSTNSSCPWTALH